MTRKQVAAVAAEWRPRGWDVFAAARFGFKALHWKAAEPFRLPAWEGSMT